MKEIFRKAKVLAVAVLFLAIVVAMFAYAATDPFGFGKWTSIIVAYVIMLVAIYAYSFYVDVQEVDSGLN